VSIGAPVGGKAVEAWRWRPTLI